jgi:integrase
MNSSSTKKIYGIGLSHFETFLHEKYEGKHTLTTIIQALLDKEIDVYSLLNEFIQHLFKLNGERKLSQSSINNYLASVRSYLQNYDIEISTWKFKHKVRIPKTPLGEEQPIDASDIRKILKATNNRRLKAYLLVLASSGLRATEAITLRIKDFDFESIPTRIHVRSEFSKTRVERFVYISNEATEAVKQWIDFKYRKRDYESELRVKSPDDVVFTIKKQLIRPGGVYVKIFVEFNRILKTVGLEERKDGMKRRKITLHSFRRFVYTMISDQVGKNYAEHWLGHATSEYHVKKEDQKRELYFTKCMKYLTFLDFEQLETTGKNIELKLEEKDRELAYLRHTGRENKELMTEMSDRLIKLTQQVEELQRKSKAQSN